MERLEERFGFAIRLVAGFFFGSVVALGASMISFGARGFPDIPFTPIWLVGNAVLAMGVSGYAAYWCIRMLSWPVSIRPEAAWAFLVGSVTLCTWMFLAALPPEDAFALALSGLRVLAPVGVAAYMVARSHSSEASAVQDPGPYSV